MKRSAAVLVCGGLLTFGAVGVFGQPSEVQRIEEDQPGWDCRTMGNRVCGSDAQRLSDELGPEWVCWVEVKVSDPPETLCSRG